MAHACVPDIVFGAHLRQRFQLLCFPIPFFGVHAFHCVDATCRTFRYWGWP